MVGWLRAVSTKDGMGMGGGGEHGENLLQGRREACEGGRIYEGIRVGKMTEGR